MNIIIQRFDKNSFISVNGTPLEVTDKGVDIPLAGVIGIKLAGYTSNEDINLDVVDGTVSIPLATPTTQGLMDVGDRTFIDNIGQKLVDKGWVQANMGGQGPRISLTNKTYTGEQPYLYLRPCRKPDECADG